MDLDLQAQRAAEEHLVACWAWMEDEGPEPDMAGPFCGCETCQVRETLHAAWPFLRQLALTEGFPAVSYKGTQVSGAPSDGPGSPQ